MLLTLFTAVNAQYAVRVHSRHESVQDLNISRPRIFVVNTGTETIRDFYYYYYFTVENNKVPTIERYYTPNCQVTLEDLGNGDYRVRYDYRNVNFRPGDILPDAQGNVVGLRYIDWSPWDKTNDYSFDNSETFQQTGKIPVFLANGTQISGSALPNPETPPQPPEIKYSNTLYAVYSTEYTDLRDRATVRGGIVGSLTYTEVGCDAVVNGKLLSGGDIFLRERAKINGDAAASQQIKKQNNTVISGTERSFSEINFPQITSHQVSIGTRDAVIGPNGSGTINPGSYREIVIYANSAVTFLAGVYNVDRLIIEPDVKLTFESQRGKKTDIRVKSECRFGDRTKMQFTGDATPLSVSIYSEQTSQFRIGTDAVIYGQITAPKASVVVNSRTTVFGMIMGRQVIIEPNATVCKPAVLMDFWHSEWAYAKTFSPLTFEYKAVVPDNITTLQFIPYVQDGATVLVNGNTSGNGANVPVSLSGPSTNIIVEVRSPDNCGKTEYVINVQRSSDYKIFVDAKSPATQGREDGRSWRSAFKCLQQAIDLAGEEGKEIWVAEGTYYPVFRADSNDARTATFMVRPGINIIGGFEGTETERSPAGSPYLTILSGDLAKNDKVLWPPTEDDLQYMNDNAYHVVTIDGNEGSKSVKIEGVTIKGGVANGSGINSVGAGILNKNCSPTLVLTIIEKNYSISHGAGIMDQGGISKIMNCLFQDNISMSGNGAGLHISKGNLKIDASVFSNNVISGTTGDGGAAFVDGAKLEMVNSVFTQNKVPSLGGAIFCKNSEISFINNTLFQNRATDANSVWNENSAVKILNSILWSDGANNVKEINGGIFNVSFSCIRSGYEGEGNIDSSPGFTDPSRPAGENNEFGDIDDGLNLSAQSSCIGTGSQSGFPETDILGFERFGSRSDIGAYAYKPTNNEFLGIIRGGQFVAIRPFTVVNEVTDEEAVEDCISGGFARVVQIEVPKNKHTDKKNIIHADITGLNPNGSSLTRPTRIRLIRIGRSQLFRSYYNNEGEVFGKYLVFTNSNGVHGEFTRAYAIHSAVNGQIRIYVPHDQFK